MSRLFDLDMSGSSKNILAGQNLRQGGEGTGKNIGVQGK